MSSKTPVWDLDEGDTFLFMGETYKLSRFDCDTQGNILDAFCIREDEDREKSINPYEVVVFLYR